MSKDYNPEQTAAIHAVNETLQAANLPTYSELEQNFYSLTVAAHESIETGKFLLKRLNQIENAQGKENGG